MYFPADYYYAGIAIGVAGSVFMAFAMFLIKYNLLSSTKRQSENIGKTLKAVRFAELLLMFLGLFCAFMSCVFAPVTLVISLYSVIILITLSLDWIILRQTIALVPKVGVLLTLPAIAMVIVNSGSKVMMTTESMVNALFSAPFLIIAGLLLLGNVIIVVLLYGSSIKQRYAFIPLRCGRFICSPFDLRLSDVTQYLLTSYVVSTVAFCMTIAMKCLAIAVRGSILFGVQYISQPTVTTESSQASSPVTVDVASTVISWLLAFALLVFMAYCTASLSRISVFPNQMRSRKDSFPMVKVTNTDPVPSTTSDIVPLSVEAISEVEMYHRGITQLKTATTSNEHESRLGDENSSILREIENDRSVTANGLQRSQSNGKAGRLESADQNTATEQDDSLVQFMRSLCFTETNFLVLLVSPFIFDDWIGLDVIQVISKLAGCLTIWFGVFLLSSFRTLPYDVTIRSVVMREGGNPDSNANHSDVGALDERQRARVRINSNYHDRSQVSALSATQDDDIIP